MIKEKVLKTLEFDKILNLLSEMAVMETTKEEISRLIPLTNIKKITETLNETDEAAMLVTKKGHLPIMCSRDVRSALKHASMGGVLSMGELLGVAKLLDTSVRIKKYPDDTKLEFLEEHIDSLYDDNKLRDKITSCIIDEETMADGASSELNDIRRKIRGSSNKIKDTLQKFTTSTTYRKYLQEQIVTMRDDRYVIPVKAEYKGEIRGIVHDVSQTGSTVFIEPDSVVELNNEIKRLSIEEKKEIERILMELSSDVSLVSKLLEMTYETVILLDMIFARANFAHRYDCFKPLINQDGHIDLIKARHPLLDRQKAVPIDVHLGDEYDTLIITGPNTGGKTVALKTVGLLTLMAQTGLFIPAKEGSKISVFENVFADIGDEQSIEQSLSTFSAHMVNIVDILDKVDGSSLCLFDELGAGTDPVEGAALAISILEFVRTMGAKCMATTHYSELKLYALSTDGVENGSCEFDIKTLMPTYKLLIGIPGKSNAFAISKRLGLSDHIINNAKNHINTENIKFEDILSDLEKNRQKAEEEKKRAEAYKKEADRLRREMQEKNKALSEKTEKIVEKARKEAKDIIDKAKDEADEALSEIRKAQKMKDEREANRAAERARQDLLKKSKEQASGIGNSVFDKKTSSKPPKTLKAGDTVQIVNLNQTGTVINPPDSKGDVQIRVGIMKIKAHISNLKLIKPPEEKKPERKVYSERLNKTMSACTEVDIRGQNVEDAIYILDKFIDDAMLCSLHQIRIIHGKGTGVLRNGIHQYLKKHPGIRTYHLAAFGEGDSGVTIAELK